MYYRCELLINGLKYRVTDDLENWDEVKTSFKRNDYDGVTTLDRRENLYSRTQERFLDSSKL